MSMRLCAAMASSFDGDDHHRVASENWRKLTAFQSNKSLNGQIKSIEFASQQVSRKKRKRRRTKSMSSNQDKEEEEAVRQSQMFSFAATTTYRSQLKNRQNPPRFKSKSRTSTKHCYLAQLIVLHSILLLISLNGGQQLLSAAQSLANSNENPQQQQQQQLAANSKPSSQTTTQKLINGGSGSNATSQHSIEGRRYPAAAAANLNETEQEVDLLHRPQHLPLINQAQQRHDKPARARGSRIYRIRAVQPMNGRLGGPVRVVAEQRDLSSGDTDETSDRLADRTGQANSMPQFGARWAPATSSRVKQMNNSQLFDLSAASSTKVNSNSRQQFPCNQSSAADQMAGANANDLAERSNSIAATSQTLHLLAPSHRAQQPQQVLKSPARPQTAPLPPGGEIDESESSPNGRPVAQPAGATVNSSSAIGQQQQQTEFGETISVPPSSIDVDFDSQIVTNRTKAQLSCDSGEMIVRLNFTEPFKGIVYPDHNRLSPCRFFGDGHHNYELRLPLRGCGTRQIAPRIFVNDVIVRFHKTLELEEDEVKTLICRYPPPASPVAATPNNYDGGGGGGQFTGLVQELDNNFNQIQRVRQQQQPFELLDPIVQNGFQHRSPSSRIISSKHPNVNSPVQGTVEILSSQLAPPFGGNPNQNLPQSSSSYDFAPGAGLKSSFLGPRNNQQQQQQQQEPPFLFGPRRNEQPANTQQKNANIISAVPPQPPSDNSDAILFAGSGSIQEIGADGQQRGQASFFDRLSSIELLFLISSLMFLVLLAFGLLGTYYCFHRRRHQAAPSAGAILRRKRRYLSGGGAAPLYSHQSSLHPTPLASDSTHQQFSPTTVPILHPHHQQSRHHHQRHASLAGISPMVYQQQQHHMNVPSSSSPESNVSGQVLIPAGKSSSRLMANSQQLPSMVNTGDYHHASYKQYDQPTADLPHYQLHRAADVGASSIRRQPPVLGRRETIYTSNGPALGRAHKVAPVANLNSFYGQQQQLHQVSTLGRRQRPGKQVNQQPLLQIAKDYTRQNGSMVDLLGKDEYAMARARSLQQLHQSAAAAVQQRHLPGAAPDGWRSLSRADSRRADGPRVLPTHLHRAGQSMAKEQQRPPPPPTVGRQRTILRPVGFRQKTTNDGDDDRVEISTSDSEIELKTSGQQQQQQRSRPRIYLKSIEDRFITNFTEIKEQEYLHRDTRKPISWAQWKSMQSNVAAGPKSNYKTPTSDTNNQTEDTSRGEKQQQQHSDLDQTKRRQSSEQQQRNVDVGDDDDDDDDNDDQYQSNRANLRSLTELDVNFAKTLRINPSAEKRNLEAAKKLDDEKRETPGGSEKRPIESKQQKPTKAEQQQAASSPDLIISPDYEIGDKNGQSRGEQQARMRLVDSPESTGSVSYV